MTTRILTLIDALGSLVRFTLLPGHRFDLAGLPPLIDGISFSALIADKTLDSNSIIAALNKCGARIITSQQPHIAHTHSSERVYAAFETWNARLPAGAQAENAPLAALGCEGIREYPDAMARLQ